MALMTRRFRAARRRRRGQSLVEFALVLPVFVLLLGGMIQFGVIFWGQNTLNQVVRDTGRYAATRNCSAAAKTASEATFATILASAGGPWKTPAVTVTYSSATCPINNTGEVWVNVTASIDAPVFFVWVPGNGHLSSTTDFRVEPQP
jgi:Flp pilus assembly protein TadG